MMDPGESARDKLIRWLLELLDRTDRPWNRTQRAFLDSLLRGTEGTKTLAELAVTSARIRASGLTPEAMGRLAIVHQAIEAFWDDPCAETYVGVRMAGRSLDVDT